MWSQLKHTLEKISDAVDWFIPQELKDDTSVAPGARMFIFSHLFGPFLGHTISLYILIEGGTVDVPWAIFFCAITAFWPFLFLLRWTGWYKTLALVSVENLLFCIMWGCYHYGGMSSPILPWLLTAPLLAFFYLPQAKTRIVVSVLIVANLLAFYAIYARLGFPIAAKIDELSGLGFVSTLCAGAYVSMMALYYRNVVSSQSDLEREVQRHLETGRQLTSATEQAQRAIRTKTEFLANMSHELRTPLNAIIGYSEILMGDADEHDQQWDDLQAINTAGNNLLHRINDLLDLAKLEAGKMDLSVESFSVEEFVDQAAAECGAPVRAKGLEFLVERIGVLGEATADRAKLMQVISNLLDNAAKFTEAGSVTMTVANRNGRLSILVKDTGCGIAPEETDTLFESFCIRESETTSGYRDPALGLPLCHRLCALMGGELAVESEVGRGSCFTVRVPCAPADEAFYSLAA